MRLELTPARPARLARPSSPAPPPLPPPLLPSLSRLQTVLVPQPSDDPRDPLNWAERKKFAILLVIAFAAFIGDFQSGAGASTAHSSPGRSRC